MIARTPCVVSVASIWEVSIKHRLGKLPVDPATFRDECLAAGAAVMPIGDAHVIESGRLPDVHQDPFDRLLIAQARSHENDRHRARAVGAAHDFGKLEAVHARHVHIEQR
jgi:PIN domain nuclease of toxin-antitoxin system